MQDTSVPEDGTNVEEKTIAGPPPENKSDNNKNADVTIATVLTPPCYENLPPIEKLHPVIFKNTPMSPLTPIYTNTPTKKDRTTLCRSQIPVKAQIRKPINVVPPIKKRSTNVISKQTQLEAEKYEKLKGLAMQGTLLPGGNTPAEKRLIDKLRLELGLPPRPKSVYMKIKHAKAADFGLLQPLEGKTYEEKENILRGLLDAGVLLPSGRTLSEKALVAKVKAEKNRASWANRNIDMSRDMKDFKHTLPETQKLSEKAIERKSLSRKKTTPTVRFNLDSLPDSEAKSISMNKVASDVGLLKILEGKPAKDKQKILKMLADMNIILPDGRTVSEKALITKVKKKTLSSSFATLVDQICLVKNTNSQGVQKPEPGEKMFNETAVQIKSLCKLESMSENESISKRQKISASRILSDNTLSKSKTKLKNLLTRIMHEVRTEYSGNLENVLTLLGNALIINKNGSQILRPLPLRSKEKIRNGIRTIIPTNKKPKYQEINKNCTKSNNTLTETRNNSLTGLIVKQRSMLKGKDQKAKILRRKSNIGQTLSDSNTNSTKLDKRLLESVYKISSSNLRMLIPNAMSTAQAINTTIKDVRRINKDLMDAELLTLPKKETSGHNYEILSSDKLEEGKRTALLTWLLRAFNHVANTQNTSKLCLSLSKLKTMSEISLDDKMRRNELGGPMTVACMDWYTDLLPNEKRKVLRNQFNFDIPITGSSFIIENFLRRSSALSKRPVKLKSQSSTNTYLVLLNGRNMLSSTLGFINHPIKDQITKEKETDKNTAVAEKSKMSTVDFEQQKGSEGVLLTTLPSLTSAYNCAGKMVDMATSIINIVTSKSHNQHAVKSVETEEMTQADKLVSPQQSKLLKPKTNSTASNLSISKEYKYKNSTNLNCDCETGNCKKKVRFKNSFIKIIPSSHTIYCDCCPTSNCNLGNNTITASKAVGISLSLKKNDIATDFVKASTNDVLILNRAERAKISNVNILFDKNRQINNLEHRLKVYT